MVRITLRWRSGNRKCASWKRLFLEQGTRGLKTRSDPEERELTLARAKIGELMMRLELAEHLIEKRGLADEWKKHKR